MEMAKIGPGLAGGKYDGVLGGLEIVRQLNDLNIQTKHPIVVTNWTNEQGKRFAPAMRQHKFSIFKRFH